MRAVAAEHGAFDQRKRRQQLNRMLLRALFFVCPRAYQGAADAHDGRRKLVRVADVRDSGRVETPQIRREHGVRIALDDDYFVSRKLYPNVDFYSGIIFRALGLPPAMFTPVFAVARTVGWVAHWNEMMTDPETRIVRPRQLYVGSEERPVVAVEKRREHAPLVG